MIPGQSPPTNIITALTFFGSKYKFFLGPALRNLLLLDISFPGVKLYFYNIKQSALTKLLSGRKP